MTESPPEIARQFDRGEGDAVFAPDEAEGDE